MPAIIYAHGGSFFTLSGEFAQNMCQSLADITNARIFNVDYSLTKLLENEIINGPSIIKKSFVYENEYHSSNSRGGTSMTSLFSYQIGNKTFKRHVNFSDYKENTYHYIYWNIECAKEKTLGFYNIPNLPYDFKLTDPSFTENGKFYTNGDDVWEALKSGVPSKFADTEFFGDVTSKILKYKE
mgnify:CR=1 FL=1